MHDISGDRKGPRPAVFSICEDPTNSTNCGARRVQVQGIIQVIHSFTLATGASPLSLSETMSNGNIVHLTSTRELDAIISKSKDKLTVSLQFYGKHTTATIR